MKVFERVRAALATLSRFVGQSRFTGPVLILLAAALVWVPYFARGLSCGHDFDFHFESWYEIAQGWKGGALYPHWAQSPNWGAGEPRFIFYPPLTWILGAALGTTLSWVMAAPMLIWILLSATGLSVRALAREWFADGVATLAGAIAIFSGYTLFSVFERSAFSEVAGGVFIPLVLLFTLRQKNPDAKTLAQKIFDGSVLPLALTLAGVWLTNAPAAVIACYLLAFVASIAAIVERSIWPLLRAAIALPLALMAAAIYIVPAAYEQRWIDIAQATSIGMRIEDSWLFARHAAVDMALHDEVLRAASLILTTMFVLTVIGFLIAWKRRQLEPITRRSFVTLATLPILVLLLQFPVTAFFWNHLPKLAFLQFPWRLLLVLETPLAIFLAAASTTTRKSTRVMIATSWVILFVLVTTISGLIFYQSCDADDSVGGQIASITSGSGVGGTDEYAPTGGDNSLVATSLPDGCLVSDPTVALGEGADDTTPAWDPEQGTCDATYTATLWQPEHKRLTAETDDDGTLILRVRAYPAWRISLNGKPVANLVKRDDGLIAIPVSEGTNEIAIDWTTTPDVFWGRILSLLSLPTLIVLFWIERRIQRKQRAAPLI
jgi:hypothetical protein